jgi:hypothetical protein
MSCRDSTFLDSSATKGTIDNIHNSEAIEIQLIVIDIQCFHEEGDVWPLGFCVLSVSLRGTYGSVLLGSRRGM